ncbi:hypothetical protein BH11PLA1_BH11PLA1_17760 [soil metagenome]
MSVSQVHWHEGLFMQPHHLQLLQRQGLERSALERRLASPFPYGVVEARLATDALENMQVRFERLVAIMPGGAVIDIPHNADLPALDIKRALAAGGGSVTVSLALPSWQGGRANTLDQTTGDDARVKRMFKISEQSITDENTGDNAQPVALRRLNARLITENEDRTELETIPVCRITRGAGEEAGLARVDAKFVPPCFVAGGSAGLMKLLRDIADGVEASRKEQALQLSKSGWTPENLRGAQFIQLQKLRTLNRYAARLSSIVHAVTAGSAAASGGALPTFNLYLELRELHAELAALHPDRDPFDAPKYDHDNPGPVFYDLESRLRQLLRDQGVKPAKKIPFAPDGADLALDLSAEDLGASDILLGVRTKMDPRALKELIEDKEKFKMMNYSQRRLRLFGVKLEEERYVVGVPTPPGQHYFRLNRTHEQGEKRWAGIQQEKKMALVWPPEEHFEYEDVALYLMFA